MASIKTRGRTKTSGSGARYVAFRKPKQYELSGKWTATAIGQSKIKNQRKRSGTVKQRLLHANKVNLFDPKTKKHSVVDVETVLENPANPQYVRRNIITRGTVVQTSKGKARITSKPGQQGYLNAVLI
ncbi:30S ribosomal protein S8e [Candidatus Woesearchaeota archaeon]|nr:30S ribosomal protein S8e [Candidatus Woesearchaeota archaeon]